MQATLNPQDRREGRDGQIGTRPSPAICRSGAPELGVVVSPRPPSEQVLRDLSRAPPETYGSALKAVLRILAHLSSRPAARLQLAYLEVYNDTINDLLPRSDGQGRAAGHDLRLRESASEGVFVEGLQYCEVSSPQQVFTAIAAGNQARHVAGTNVNSRSSL